MFQAASSSYVRQIPRGTTGPAVGDVLIGEHGDRNRYPLQCGGLRVSWEVNAAGEFSGFARLTDVLTLTDAPSNLRGWWLWWEHPYLGPWGGVIQEVAIRSGNVVEIAARGWLSLLDKRLTRRRDLAILAHAGAIAARLVRDAGAVEPTGITGVSADEWGEFVAWRDSGSDVLNAVSSLALMSNQDYVVGMADRVFYWRRSYGTDRSHNVQLVQGKHIAEWRPMWALAPVVTEVILSPSDRNRFARPVAVAGRDAEAYAAFGPRQERGAIRGMVARQTVQAVASRQAEHLAARGRVIDLDVPNTDGCWDWFGFGDTITVNLPDIDDALVVRCRVRSWDQQSDVCRVSGEIVA